MLLVTAAQDGLRAALDGFSCATAADGAAARAALAAEDFAVVVLGPDVDEVLAGLGAVRHAATVVQVAADDDPMRLARSVRQAIDLRGLRLDRALRERTDGLLQIVDPELLSAGIAAVARAVTDADHAAFFAPGPEGTLVPHLSPADAPVPVGVLARRSQRMERQPPPGPVTDPLPELHALATVVGRSERFLGVLWVLRAEAARPFSARERVAFEAVAGTASLAADHLRLVRDLQRRIAAMDATRRRLEQDGRDATVGRRAVDALHALRSPLAYVRTNLRAAVDSGEVPAGSTAARHVEYALEGLDRADKAVEDLSRVSAGRERAPIEVRQLVEGALGLARPLRIAESVEIGENAVILGHFGRLSHALAELLRNADQAEGATLVALKASRVGDEVLIEIADDGEGIPPDLVPRVTEAFFSTRGRAGLGLATCREVVEQSGGTLEIWSRRGVGTIARVQLPGEWIDDELVVGDADEGDEGDEAGEE